MKNTHILYMFTHLADALIQSDKQKCFEVFIYEYIDTGLLGYRLRTAWVWNSVGIAHRNNYFYLLIDLFLMWENFLQRVNWAQR